SNIAPCEMHTLEPIFTGARLSIQTFSPIQLLSPISSFQGYLIFTPGFITTPLPKRAPKSFRRNAFRPLEGFNELIKKIELTKYQAICFAFPAPISFLYQLLL